MSTASRLRPAVLPWLRPRRAPRLGYYYSTENNKPPMTSANEYLEKLQATIQPRLTPVLLKVRNASDTLRNITRDLNDPKEAIQRAGVALNQLTGYDQIEKVKQHVTDQAKAFETSRDQMQQAKRAYESAIDTRSSTQREINELLQRKHLWSGEDVTRFTELYRLEHEHSQREIHAKEAYQHAEKQMDREYMGLAQSIMERYHEEQLWSDKIRSVSTYGTWALMVLNLVLFIMMQSIFEPYKRKRLTDRFEELLIAKVDEEESKFRGLMQDRDDTQLSVLNAVNELAAAVASGNQHLESQLKLTTSQPQQEPDTQPSSSSSSSLPLPTQEQQLSSDENLVLRKRDLILYSVESAVAGGVIASLAMFLWK
ncbi:mitochondrion biogenesis protein [Lichtheimia corymbifera JMRC:FSU:9682]|uniref:Sensitive to high expression protein 9, mitochondrial n=1 Tax=Lichtheimia corymbifera JMRC:FSU:9682 TaxID=1263082 RepID=A0A068SJ18_9FUNG|nr:mitochondrion biogenesis protein [Lichtheimia corymbifera JMRC:FSU:9682]